MPISPAAPRNRARRRRRGPGRASLSLLLAASVLFAACDGGGMGGAVIPQLPGNQTGGGTGGSGVVAGQDIDAFGTAVVGAIDQSRTQLGLATLTVDPKLVAAAQLQATQMMRTGVFEHSIAGVAYPTLIDRVDATTYAWTSLAESIAKGTDAAGVVSGWMGTPADRANLASSTYTQIGVAEATNVAGVQFVVAVLAKPKS